MRVQSEGARRSYLVPVPESDIDACIRFSRLRCAISIFSLLLACTDIPRTGLGIRSIASIMTPVAPDSGIIFGPYAYPIAHIVKVPSSEDNSTGLTYKGSSDDSEILSTDVWSYKFDSVSIAQRGLVQELELMSAWPSCIFYQEECPGKQLSLETTFSMIDALTGAVHTKLFPNQTAGNVAPAFVYLVWSNWIDRVHHYLLQLLNICHRESRISSVHYYQLSDDNATLDICSHHPNRPFTCDVGVGWAFEALTGSNKSTPLPLPLVSFADHIQTRVARLQQEYPQLNLDVTLILSLDITSNEGDIWFTRWSFFRSDIGEVTTLVRGRTCISRETIHSQESDCETVFVDDYRYERSTVVTDLTHWYRVTSVLRSFSQGYMWLRIGMLWLGCFKARLSEIKFVSATKWELLWSTWGTFFRIPGNVVVYSSWIPVLGYAAAHMVDSVLVHSHADILGASLNGAASYGFWTYLQAASVQMRDIWIIAAVVKLFTSVQMYCLPAYWRRREGLRSVRGGWIGWFSALTVVGPFRVLSVRDSNVVSVQPIPVELIKLYSDMDLVYEDSSEFGIRLDVTTIFEALFWTMSIVAAGKCCLWLSSYCNETHDQQKSVERMHFSFSMSLIFCRSHYLPYSIGTLCDTTSMSVYWRIGLMDPNRTKMRGVNNSSVAIAPITISQPEHVLSPVNASSRSMQRSSTLRLLKCKTCVINRTHWGWPSVQGCPNHNGIYEIDRRSKAVWSMIRLINLAMFTDPVVWLSLYLFGRRLFLYRILRKKGSVPLSVPSRLSTGPNRLDEVDSRLVLLPCCPKQLMKEIDEHFDYELVDFVDSTKVPWTLLLMCG